jgi:hypothetical protein
MLGMPKKADRCEIKMHKYGTKRERDSLKNKIEA